MGWEAVKANVVTELKGWLEPCQAERLQRWCWGQGRGWERKLVGRPASPQPWA